METKQLVTFSYVDFRITASYLSSDVCDGSSH
jgi:hypothetical protein